MKLPVVRDGDLIWGEPLPVTRAVKELPEEKEILSRFFSYGGRSRTGETEGGEHRRDV